MRLKKVQLNLTACAATAAEIDDKPNPYLKPVKAILEKTAADLRDMTQKMHDEALNNGDKHNELWADAVKLCAGLKRDIDSAWAFLHQGNFARYTTVLDGPLGMK